MACTDVTRKCQVLCNYSVYMFKLLVETQLGWNKVHTTFRHSLSNYGFIVFLLNWRVWRFYLSQNGSYAWKIGMLQVTELSRDDTELILWRTGIHKRTLMTICLHHHKQYLEKFTTLNPFCCDPFRHHDEKKIIKVLFSSH